MTRTGSSSTPRARGATSDGPRLSLVQDPHATREAAGRGAASRLHSTCRQGTWGHGLPQGATQRALAELLAQPAHARRLGPFVLTEPLGAGGFAPVWLARETYGDSELRTVAVKLFAVEALDAGDAGRERVGHVERARIVEEARALCRVEHPNVVRFHALASNAAGTVLGLAMEHVRGRSVRRRLDAEGAMPMGAVLDVGVAVASALAAVHQVGLVHRDVKPDNVVDAHGIYKLIDFGIAHSKVPVAAHRSRKVIIDDLPLELVGTKMTGLTARLRTANPGLALGWASGTVGYMDPAGFAAAPTPAGDLYALGALLFECVVGRLPAAAAAARAGKRGLAGEVLDGRAAAPSLGTLVPGAPPALARLVDALLTADPRARPRSAEAVAWELERIRLELGGAARALPPEEVGPFRGLGRFEERDRDVYFGRSTEIAAALALLRTHGLLALVGPSGSGKSSLARAGVLDAVRAGGLGRWPARWHTATGSPGGDGRAAVAIMVDELCESMARVDAAMAASLRRAALPLRAPDDLVDALAAHVDQTGHGVMLLFDQLEELVVFGGASGRTWVAQLLVLLGERALPGVRAVVTARRDLLDPLLADPDLGRVLTRGTLLLTPMSHATWREVVDQALGAYGYCLEDEAMRDELLAEVEQTAGAMPLVQFALSELWARRDRARKLIPRSALRAVGGIAGALDMHAEATRDALVASEPALEPVVDEVVLALTTAQGTRATQPLAALAELGSAPRIERIIATFEQARLLVRDGDGVTLAHEALLGQWQRLRGWLAAARADRVFAEELEREAAAWYREPSDDRVWRRRRLFAADDLAGSRRVRLSAKARAFLRAGLDLERRRRWLRIAAALLGLLGLAAGVSGYVLSLRAEQRATERALGQADLEAERARELAGTAQTNEHAAVVAKLTANDARSEADRLRLAYQSDLEDLEQRVTEAGRDLEKVRAIQEEIARKRGRELPPLPPAPGTRGRDGIQVGRCKPHDPMCTDL